MKFKRGDMFSVQVSNGNRFFQYLEDDSTQLSSNVVCVFKLISSAVENVSVEEIKASGVDFYAHVLIKLGTKLGVWTRLSGAEINLHDDPWFRDSSDYGNPKIKETNNWWLWQINRPRSELCGRTDQLRQSHIGIVVTPDDVIKRLELGSYQFFYPKYIEEK